MLSYKRNYFLMLSFLLLIQNQNSYAGGIALGATRVIYPSDSKQVSLPVTNSDDKESYLIQSWLSRSDGTKSNDFVLTPPLFAMMPKKENVLRIMYSGVPLATDRESVFYLNVKAIPAINKESLKGNNLQIATQSIIKVFMRPKGLPIPSSQAPEALRCSFTDGNINIKNPSPYFVSLVQLLFGGVKLKSEMVPPKGNIDVSVPSGSHGPFSFQTINDYGAVTARQTCS